MYGYKLVDQAPLGAPYNVPVAISASQSAADIHSGANLKLDDHDEIVASKAIDNEFEAFENETPLYAWNQISGTTNPIRRYTSIQPKLISTCDLNLCNSPLGLSNKLFAHFSYAWKDREDNLIPFIGMGYELEFGSKDICRFGVTQWGAWVKGGFYWE